MINEIQNTHESEELEYMNSVEAARYLRLIKTNGKPNTNQLRGLVHDGRVPFYKPFGRLLFKKSELDKMINDTKKGGYRNGYKKIR